MRVLRDVAREAPLNVRAPLAPTLSLSGVERRSAANDGLAVAAPAKWQCEGRNRELRGNLEAGSNLQVGGWRARGLGWTIVRPVGINGHNCHRTRSRGAADRRVPSGARLKTTTKRVILLGLLLLLLLAIEPEADGRAEAHHNAADGSTNRAASASATLCQFIISTDALRARGSRWS